MTHNSSRKILLALAMAGAALPSLAWADTKADLEARYTELKAALDTREPDKIKPLLTPDFTDIALDGQKQTADDMIDRLSMIPVDPERKATVSIESVQEDGGTAQVMVREATSGSREGRDGQVHAFAMSRLSHDTWVRGDKGWQLKSIEAEEMSMSRDGQVMRTLKKGDPMPMGRGMGGRGRGGNGPGGGPGDGPMGPPPGGPEGQ
ncbi:nuclear transport factor 2 family protein [Novosphingobium album (ex Liu et al. 2023)]|uniref:Nuclear transport factor 2 family protein n=1 Tax=Novosphingobium album (ex Liu et al. 2023) TaxID=3031130 RepID=A0ABT5WTB8_9SPHN|nr:nuclear transport factor 2 family protein [Novosphingobium album (ex Liu et al. 2023)]MDE8652663.1 nuclear transport factor 2 family protein [Novosphingobium album (ex Liu et al. 2023)]